MTKSVSDRSPSRSMNRGAVGSVKLMSSEREDASANAMVAYMISRSVKKYTIFCDKMTHVEFSQMESYSGWDVENIIIFKFFRTYGQFRRELSSTFCMNGCVNASDLHFTISKAPYKLWVTLAAPREWKVLDNVPQRLRADSQTRVTWVVRDTRSQQGSRSQKQKPMGLNDTCGTASIDSLPHRSAFPRASPHLRRWLSGRSHRPRLTIRICPPFSPQFCA